LAIVGIELAHLVRGGVEHLLRHRDGIGKLLEIEKREFLRRRDRDDLVVEVAEKFFDRLKLALDKLYTLLDLVE
jgi:hypothetical protein